MEEKTDRLSEADKQVRRLEALRLQHQQQTAENAQRAFDPGRTFVEKTIDRLQSLKSGSARKEAIAGKPSVFQPVPGRLHVRGQWRSIKLSDIQVKALERISVQDKNLRKSDVVRIALNRFLGLPQSPGENEWELRIHELLERIKKDSR